MQELYNFEANQVVQCVYQPTNLVVGQQPAPNKFQPQNFYTNQHDTPIQTQLIQVIVYTRSYYDDTKGFQHFCHKQVIPHESLSCILFQESVSTSGQLRQVNTSFCSNNCNNDTDKFVYFI